MTTQSIRDFLANYPATEHETLSAMLPADRVKNNALQVVAGMYGDSDLGCLLAALAKAERAENVVARCQTEDTAQEFEDAMEAVSAAFDTYRESTGSDATGYWRQAK
jgi:hypothetical protein